MEKKLKAKQKAVRDARKFEEQARQLQAKACVGDPFSKFFGAMADLMSGLADSVQQELSGEAPAEELPFEDSDDDDDDDLGGESDV